MAKLILRICVCPFHDSVILAEIGLVTLQLVDAEGKLIMEKGFRNLPKGMNLITVDLQAYGPWPNGM